MKKIINLIILSSVLFIPACSEVIYNNPADPYSDDFIPANIILTANDVNIPNNSIYEFDPVGKEKEGDPVGFTIRNSGLGTLTINDILITGDDTGDFDIDSFYMENILLSGSETKFTIKFKPETYGEKTAMVTLSCAGTESGNFVFTITGSVLAPDIRITMNDDGKVIEQGDFIDFGHIKKGYLTDTVRLIFNIENTGTDVLEMEGIPEYVNITGPNKDNFVVYKQPRASIDPGKYDTLIIDIEKTEALLNNSFADVSINTNDEDQDEFKFYLMVKKNDKLITSQSEDIWGFGYSVGLSGNYAIVSSCWDDSETELGTAQIFELVNGEWTEQAILMPLDQVMFDFFGCSVSIYGDYIIVGAYNKDGGVGAAYIFQNESGVWTQKAKLTASDGNINYSFGSSVSIYGDYAIVGSPGDDTIDQNRGSAYIFKKPVSGWADATEDAKLYASDGAANYTFGGSVSIFGNYAVIGSSGDDSSDTNQGSAYIFQNESDVWTQIAKLTASDGAANDYLGSEVSIYDDYVILGCSSDDYGDYSNAGSAYIFKKPDSGWMNAVETAKLTPSNPNDNYYFGSSVAISGDYAIVTSTRTDSYRGSAYIFKKPDSGWVNTEETEIITASDAEPNDRFGISVALDGELAIIGADGDDIDYGSVANPSFGSAYIYNLNVLPQVKIESDEGSKSFGYSISISGNYAIAGAPDEDSYTGNAYILYLENNIWRKMSKLSADDGDGSDRFGTSVSMSGSNAIIGAPYKDENGFNPGAVYFFQFDGTDWIQMGKLLASDGGDGDYFGCSVSISGDCAVIGARSDDTRIGSAYIFRLENGSWVQKAKLTLSDGAINDYFGGSVFIHGDTAIIGATGDDAGGAAYIFTKPAAGEWIDANGTAKLTSSELGTGDSFGISVSISADYAVVGCTGGSDGPESAYIFKKPLTGWDEDNDPGTIDTLYETDKLSAIDTEENDKFGSSVYISDSTIIVGAPEDDEDDHSNCGSFYVYSLIADEWIFKHKIKASDNDDGTDFGYTVGYSNNYIITGANDDNEGAGSVYLYKYGD